MLGNCTKEYKQHLLKLSENTKAICFLEPVSPDTIFEIAAKYDIGLATEVPHSENREICLTNKLFTYLLAGNCILSSDTSAQKKFMEENVGIGVLYKNDNPADLASQIRKLYDTPETVLNCRKKSLELAGTSLNWEIESQKFLKVIEETLSINKNLYETDVAAVQSFS